MGEAFGVGQRESAAGEFVCGFALEFREQLGDLARGGERPLGGDAVDETHVDRRDRSERRWELRVGELGEARQAERRPRRHLLGDRRVGGHVHAVHLEQQQRGRGGDAGAEFGERGGRSGVVRACVVRVGGARVVVARIVGDRVVGARCVRARVIRAEERRDIRLGRAVAELACRSDHGEHATVEAHELVLDARAVEQCLGEVEEVFDADHLHATRAQHRGEGGVVEGAKSRGEREGVAHRVTAFCPGVIGGGDAAVRTRADDAGSSLPRQPLRAHGGGR